MLHGVHCRSRYFSRVKRRKEENRRLSIIGTNASEQNPEGKEKGGKDRRERKELPSDLLKYPLPSDR